MRRRADARQVQATPQPELGRELSPRYRRRLARLAYRADVLQRAVAAQGVAPRPRRWRPSRPSRKQVLLGAGVALILGVTGYVSIDAWLTNRRVASPTGSTPALAQVEEGAHQQEQEGRDEREVKPSLLENYQTAPERPRALRIESLEVEARLLPMGVNADGSMQAPYNIFDAGWYTQSAVPSRAGAVVIDAHASGPTREGLFAYLDTMTQGDTLEVETGDGTRYTYRVVATETVKLEDINMKKLMLPYGTATHGANFITCAGDWLEGSETFNERAVVYTELVS